MSSGEESLRARRADTGPRLATPPIAWTCDDSGVPEREDSFAPLLAYYASVTTLIRRLGFSREDAADVAQDVFLRAYAHTTRNRGESPWSYLQSIARHVALSRIRDQHAAKRSPSAVSIDLDSLPAPDISDLVSDLALNELTAQLRTAVAELDPSTRVPIQLQLQGLSFREIAEALGLSEAAVKSRLRTARGQLRRLLSEIPVPRPEPPPARAGGANLGQSFYHTPIQVLRPAERETQGGNMFETERLAPSWTVVVAQLRALNQSVLKMRALIRHTLDAEGGA